MGSNEVDQFVGCLVASGFRVGVWVVYDGVCFGLFGGFGGRGSSHSGSGYGRMSGEVFLVAAVIFDRVPIVGVQIIQLSIVMI